uniref:Transcription elongation factor A3 n=1 Tax=Latimeria chalumnae TaxID=7897 RepID=H3AE10_LATCH
MAREKELIRIAKQLDNMVARKNREGILGLLRELKGYSMTLKLLQTTRIGMAVNAVRKHCTDEEIAALAKILIKNWKRLLVAERSEYRRNSLDSKLSSSPPERKHPLDSKKEKGCSGTTLPSTQAHALTQRDSFDSKFGSSPPCQKKHLSNSKKERKDSTDSKSNSHSATPKKHSLEIKAVQKFRTSSPPPKRPSTEATVERSDAMKMKSEAPRTPTSPGSPVFSPSSPPFLPPTFLTGDSIRDKCIEMLAAALRTDGEKNWNCNPYRAWVFAENMYSSCSGRSVPSFSDPGSHRTVLPAFALRIYQEMKSTDMKYKNRVRSRISNLKDPKNPSLRKSVLSGAISLSDIAKMTAEEMASDELKELRNILTQEAIREHQMSKTGGTATDLFQCGKCKKKNCTYTQVQTRSADEPMTMFVLCNECGNRWKFC